MFETLKVKGKEKKKWTERERSRENRGNIKMKKNEKKIQVKQLK